MVVETWVRGWRHCIHPEMALNGHPTSVDGAEEGSLSCYLLRAGCHNRTPRGRYSIYISARSRRDGLPHALQLRDGGRGGGRRDSQCLVDTRRMGGRHKRAQQHAVLAAGSPLDARCSRHRLQPHAVEPWRLGGPASAARWIHGSSGCIYVVWEDLGSVASLCGLFIEVSVLSKLRSGVGSVSCTPS